MFSTEKYKSSVKEMENIEILFSLVTSATMQVIHEIPYKWQKIIDRLKLQNI